MTKTEKANSSNKPQHRKTDQNEPKLKPVVMSQVP